MVNKENHEEKEDSSHVLKLELLLFTFGQLLARDRIKVVLDACSSGHSVRKNVDNWKSNGRGIE